LPEDIVEFIDEQVSEGRGRSRADVVARAMLRERRRRQAERDVQIILAHPDDGLDGLAAYASRTPLDID
jgi:Arc/MetJ-type ribon-helix-helix transcriptional regulator